MQIYIMRVFTHHFYFERQLVSFQYSFSKTEELKGQETKSGKQVTGHIMSFSVIRYVQVLGNPSKAY